MEESISIERFLSDKKQLKPPEQSAFLKVEVLISQPYLVGTQKNE